MPARLIQKVACRGPGNRALWVKLAKMLNVPGVAHLNGNFSLQTDRPRSGDTHYPVRAFPLWCQLVCTLGGLNAPKDKVAFLKTPGMNPAAMIAMQGLLIACSTRSSMETVLLE